MTKIKILTGSNRPNRFNIQPAQWIYDLAKARTDIEVELLDLQEINLPLLNEPESAKSRNYAFEHTKKWADTISDADGFIFVTPEYNHSYSAILKNALDYLFYEWAFKPVSFISYGGPIAGSRAVEHLRGVAAELQMFDLREQVVLPNYWEDLNEKGEYQFSKKQVDTAEVLLDSLVFWSEELNSSRSKLAAKEVAAFKNATAKA